MQLPHIGGFNGGCENMRHTTARYMTHTFNWHDTLFHESDNSQKARKAIDALHSGDHSLDKFMLLDP